MKSPEFGRPDLREVILGSYRIVHRVRDDEAVEVLAVIHSVRLLTPELVPEQEP
ncbi:MAG: type II toxin-antitoxin system RelE/ParE family toxin [Longimicrobiaceae bacterium]